MWFAVAMIVFPLIQWGRRVSLGGNAAMFVGPKSFRELRPLSVEEQKRVLHEADRAAFAQWRGFIPSLVFAVLFASGIAVAHILPKVTPLPDALWVWLASVVAFCGVGGWLAGRWEVRCIRPHLNDCIARIPHAA